jgi:hypothetical protein
MSQVGADPAGCRFRLVRYVLLFGSTAWDSCSLLNTESGKSLLMTT